MKRFLSLLLLAVMLLATLMLTSCNALMSTSNFVHEIFGIKRHTITEEEWNNAFDITNYTAISLTENNKTIISLDYPYMKCEIIDLSDSNNILTIYINLQTGDYCGIQNGEWTEINDKGFIVDKERASLKVDLKIDDINFADLVYDESTKSYSYNKMISGDYVFNFENGALVSLEIFLKAGANGKQIAFNFGTTVVEWPKK